MHLFLEVSISASVRICESTACFPVPILILFLGWLSHIRSTLARLPLFSLFITLYRLLRAPPRPFKPGPRIINAGIWTVHFGIDNLYLLTYWSDWTGIYVQVGTTTTKLKPIFIFLPLFDHWIPTLRMSIHTCFAHVFFHLLPPPRTPGRKSAQGGRNRPRITWGFM